MGKLSKPILTTQNKSALWLDRLGITFAVACWVHCLVLPLVVLFSPSLSGLMLNDSSFHIVLLAMILPVALIAFLLGWLRHRSRMAVMLGGFGLLLIIFSSAQVLLFEHGIFNESAEKALTSFGGLCLAMGHFLNLRQRNASISPQI